jgi:predicted RNase H-like HicB family nuclease
MKLPVTIDRDEDGMWVVECPSIPGCVSQGKTRPEALEKLKDMSLDAPLTLMKELLLSQAKDLLGLRGD